jgi:hypothetical protein
MNFLPATAIEPPLTLILTSIAFLISWLCAYYLFRTNNVIKKTEARFNHIDATIIRLEKSMLIDSTLNLALHNSNQTKNNIELCSTLLDSCTHKSDILTTKAIENSLHLEINNAIEAISGIEKKRAFLETKIKDAFTELTLKTTALELDQTLGYAQVLLEETQLEITSTEKIKLDVLKVSQVLDKVLLRL